MLPRRYSLAAEHCRDTDRARFLVHRAMCEEILSGQMYHGFGGHGAGNPWVSESDEDYDEEEDSEEEADSDEEGEEEEEEDEAPVVVVT